MTEGGGLEAVRLQQQSAGGSVDLNWVAKGRSYGEVKENLKPEIKMNKWTCENQMGLCEPPRSSGGQFCKA